MKYILASASPRRQELIKKITSNVVCIPSDIDETLPPEMIPEKGPEFLAVKKARKLAENYADCIVIGADTSVFLNNSILGKPNSRGEAEKMLKSLSGRCHKVITGCAIMQGDTVKSFSVTTKVEFYKLSDAEISEYIKTGEPMDKAGAYGIQGLGGLFVKKIDGDYYNVVGLPVARLKRELETFLKEL